VMLAEAMVDDFANAFQGVTPADAEALADAFAFEHCIVRERLADALRRSSLADFPV
jgi:endoglucanase